MKQITEFIKEQRESITESPFMDCKMDCMPKGKPDKIHNAVYNYTTLLDCLEMSVEMFDAIIEHQVGLKNRHELKGTTQYMAETALEKIIKRIEGQDD